jgi:uncharacterized integral membrane protein
MRADLMRKFVKGLIVIPLGLIFVIFAVANRHFVTVSFDPFNSTAPSVSISLPLFVLIIVVAILGVVAGGCATWFSQRHWRRAARHHGADARTVRGQLDDIRAAQAASTREEAARPVAPAQAGTYQAAPYQGGRYGVSGRDKMGATL